MALFALHLPAAEAAGLTALTGAYAVIPDLDQRVSCAGRSLGPVSGTVAWAVGKLAGGHRNGTHSILGVSVFAGVAALAGALHDRAGVIVLGLLLALAVAAGLAALRVHGTLADAGGAGATVWLAVTGWHPGLVVASVALGCSAHIAGDMLTVEGCPLLWPFSHQRMWLSPKLLRFETAHWAENAIVAPVLMIVLGLLAWHAVSLPGYFR